MRRPIYVIAIVTLVIAYIFSLYYKDPLITQENKNICVSGIIKDVQYKEKYVEYCIDDYLVKSYDYRSELKVGDYVRVTGKYKSSQNFKFKDFDYGLYLKSQGYRGVVYLKNYKILKKIRGIYYYSNYCKEAFVARTDYIFRSYGGFCSALVIGTRNDIDKESMDSFSKTGTAHILALSGYNVGIVVIILSLVFKGINRMYKLMCLCLFLVFYAFVGGLTPSIIRASIFAMIMYLSIFLDREYDGICALSLVVIMLIINNAFVIYNISFQLSFLATLSIIYFYNVIDEFVQFPLVSITLGSNIFTWPIIYYNFKIISIISVVANLLIVPVIGILTISIIIVLLLSFINIYLSICISKFVILLIQYIYLIVDYLSKLSYSYIEFKDTSLGFVLAYYLVIIIVINIREIRITKEQKNGLQGYC